MPTSRIPTTAYKLVRVRADGTYRTLYRNSRKRYQLGKASYQPARANHQGGYYVSQSPDLGAHLTRLTLPPGEYAMLECEVWGRKITYGSDYKQAWSHLRPVREVERYTLLPIAVQGTVWGVPQGWRLTTVQTRSLTMRGRGIRISEYELRAYDPTRGYYWRAYKDGYRPLVLATRTSGTGVPQWMTRYDGLSL
jgi:hypothetical protein